jgi:hypothetical protein
MENVLKHNKKIMIPKGGLNVNGFAWYFMFVQNNTPSLFFNQSITLGCPSRSSSHLVAPTSQGLAQLALVAHVALSRPFETALS